MSPLKNILLIILILSLQNVYAEDAESLIDDEVINTGEAAEDDESVFNNIPQIKILHTDINKSITDNKEVKCRTAKIIALNKVTAKSKEIEFKIGQSKYFGNIEIKVHKCLKNSDLYLPDNKILLTIVEHKIDEDSNVIFQGWLISSNLSISTFEHPVYEVFAKNCL